VDQHAATTKPLSAPGATGEDLWWRHNAAWRDTAQIASQWQEAANVDPELLNFQVHGDWWAVLEALAITLLVGREYEHLLMAISCRDRGTITFMPMPHPSGIVVDRPNKTVYVASTRNPNQIFELAPSGSGVPRDDVQVETETLAPLVPVRSTFLPGCLYLHDLALIGGQLFGNAVGQNCVVQLSADSGWHRRWWPLCMETDGVPQFQQNYIQLNSIAAGDSLAQSYFTASSQDVSPLRPGDPQYPVDGKGVLFSGMTREPLVRGLTRPHSARLDAAGKIWLANSGYGQLAVVDAQQQSFSPVCRLPGWTRGLSICGDIAFVGTSRVIPQFKAYAPGLEVESSICAVHAVQLSTGKILGSLSWPMGNQIFAIDWLPQETTGGLPFAINDRRSDRKTLFYTFTTDRPNEEMGNG